ncbi:MAG TPA: ROK family protein [Solirubrobacteraceae bacterium]|nr:ROK family protein [Solirubrobacteraceae bacterium]
MRLRGGIDLGGTKIEALVLDDAHGVVGRARADTPRDGGPPAVTEVLAATMLEALGTAGVAAEQLLGVGVGSPGVVDDAAGTVAGAGNLPDWVAPFPLAAELSQRLGGVRVRLGNDVSVAVDAERLLGAASGRRNVLGVWWGTGVGGGLVIDGELFHGRGFGGEFGHTVIRRGGALCGCGNRGCVEAYAGRKFMEAWVHAKVAEGHDTELLKLQRKHQKDRLTSGIWERGVTSGDPLALHAMERALRALGAGIASAVNLLDLEAVVVGGGMGERFFATHGPQIEQYMHLNLFRPADPPVLLPTALGDDGGALGASLLVGAS